MFDNLILCTWNNQTEYQNLDIENYSNYKKNISQKRNNIQIIPLNKKNYSNKKSIFNIPSYNKKNYSNKKLNYNFFDYKNKY
jgi:hypothetical protein